MTLTRQWRFPWATLLLWITLAGFTYGAYQDYAPEVRKVSVVVLSFIAACALPPLSRRGPELQFN